MGEQCVFRQNNTKMFFLRSPSSLPASLIFYIIPIFHLAEEHDSGVFLPITGEHLRCPLSDLYLQYQERILIGPT
jgi:hypothetical protein